MNSAQFQGSAKSTPFAPQKALDQTDAMRQQLNDQLRWMREDQQMVLNDRRDYAAALDRMMRDESSFRAKDLENLAGMSKTLTDTLLQIKKDRDQDAMEEGLVLQRLYGIPLEQAQKFDEDEQALKDARDKTNEFADRQAKAGVPPDVVAKIRGLSGWGKYGYTMGMAQQASLQWSEYLDNAFNNDDKTEIDLGNGRIITPYQAQDRAEMAAVSTVMLKKYLRENGLVGVNPALLNKYFFPGVKEGDQKVIGQRYAALISSQAQDKLDEESGLLISSLKAGDPNAFTTFVSNTRSVIDPETRRLLGAGGARRLGVKAIFKLAESGELSPELAAQIMATNIPGSTTETWGSKFPDLFVGLDDVVRQGQEADLAAQERAEEREWKAREKEIIALGEQKGGYTEFEKNEIISSYSAAGRSVPDSIARLMTVDQKEDAAAKRYLDGLLASGRGITEQDLRYGGYSNEIINAYMPRVREFETNITKNPGFQAAVKAARQNLLNLTLRGTSQGARPHWTLELSYAKAEELLRTKTMAYVQSGTPPTEAATAALADVTKLIQDGQPSSKGPGVGPFRVAVDKANPNVAQVNGGFVGLLNGVRALAQQNEAEFRRIVGTVQANKAGGRFLDIPLLGPGDLKQLERLREDPSAGFPTSVLWLSQQSRTNSPWDVADRQLKAAGLKPLTRPPEVQWSDGIDPKLRQLLNFSSSYNRTNRAYSGTPWNPAKVPNNWGAVIEKAAKREGLDPALLAGLLAHESAGWNPSAVSRAGAVGLAQIMPDTLADAGMQSLNDRLDPIKSINGAARVLGARLRAVNGDLTLALRAYNMGLAGATANPGGYRGDRESIEYPSKVLRAAASYGYGFGVGSPFRRQETMNPRLAYRIGNLGYGSTGPHLDVKPVLTGSLDGRSGRNMPAYRQGMLDQYVLVKKNGKLVPLSKGTVTTDNDAAHRARGSFGHDYAAPDGTEVYLRNGARVVSSFQGDQGTDHLIIELPDGRRFQFLHGKRV